MVSVRLIGMSGVVRSIFSFMPLFFGVGFIAPLIAQVMAAFDIAAPLGISRMAFGLSAGAPWGLYAVLRGRWL
jgi:hypothetical protein